MNRLFTTLIVSTGLFVFCAVDSAAQSFFVTPTEKGFEDKIVSKIKYEGYKLADTKESADYIVDCLVDGQYNAWKIGSMFHGYVKISDAKIGEEVARTKEVGKSPAAVNGYQAGPRIMAVIADKYLKKELDKVVSIYKQKVQQ